MEKGLNHSNNSHKRIDSYAVTGTFHGSIVYAKTEGEARGAFHKKYNGESIVNIKKRLYGNE